MQLKGSSSSSSSASIKADATFSGGLSKIRSGGAFALGPTYTSEKKAVIGFEQ